MDWFDELMRDVRQAVEAARRVGDDDCITQGSISAGDNGGYGIMQLRSNGRQVGIEQTGSGGGSIVTG